MQFTWENHLQHLRVVLKALQEAGLTANPVKCKLAVSEVTYLKSCAGGGLVKSVVDKVQALTKRQVRCFLGLAGYYWKFILRFTSNAALPDGPHKRQQPKED